MTERRRDRIILRVRGLWYGPRQRFSTAWWGALGAAIAVGGMELGAQFGSTPYALVPFVTSIVLVMGAPEADPAQPRALIGGHLISALAGYPLLLIFGPSPFVGAAGVGLAVIAMHLTRTYHPPAGINPFLIGNDGLGFGFLLAPVAVGAILLAAFTWCWHRFGGKECWPRDGWW
jgi:CBS-domain-containing membrane protein